MLLILPLFLITGATADAVANPVGKPTNAVDAKIEKYKVDDKADGDIDLERYRIWFQKTKIGILSVKMKSQKQSIM